jgi:hypothetical protein
MIQETTQSKYPGVLCSRCKEPIPVPKRIAVLYDEVKRAKLTDREDVKSGAFTLRCKACNEDSVYGTDEIREFDGPPRVRSHEKKLAASSTS